MKIEKEYDLARIHCSMISITSRLLIHDVNEKFSKNVKSGSFLIMYLIYLNKLFMEISKTSLGFEVMPAQ